MNRLIRNLVGHKEYNFDKFIFYTCILDSLFLPYIWFISIPYTIPLLFIWIFRRYKLLREDNKLQQEYKLFVILFILMGISTVYSFILAPQYAYKNIVYFILYTLMFLYYFMYAYYINKYEFQVKKLLLLFLLFVLVLAVIYNMDKALCHNIVLFWNNRSGILINENLYEGFVGYRFAFIWMDPNNVAYTMNAIVLYIWCNEETSLFTKVFSLLSLLFILVSCMSNGGFISFGVGVGLYILVSILRLCRGKHKTTYRITPGNLVLIFITIMVLYKLIPEIPSYLNSSVAIESLERIQSNSGDSRIEIWKTVMSHVNFLEYLVIGKGGVTLVDGNQFAPHNGHFYWILGYGFLAYFIFLYILFRKRKVTNIKQYIWLIPIFFGFTINVLLGEIKMMSILILLIACSSSAKYLGIPSKENVIESSNQIVGENIDG